MHNVERISPVKAEPTVLLSVPPPRAKIIFCLYDQPYQRQFWLTERAYDIHPGARRQGHPRSRQFGYRLAISLRHQGGCPGKAAGWTSDEGR